MNGALIWAFKSSDSLKYFNNAFTYSHTLSHPAARDHHLFVPPAHPEGEPLKCILSHSEAFSWRAVGDVWPTDASGW